jgi:hypothetical protein
MAERHHDLILHKPERAIADDCNCTIDDVHAIVDHHPIEVDRDQYLKRALALQLVQLDELEVVFREKARAGDTASGMLLVKIAERRATLLGLNAPIGYAVAVVQHAPENRPTSTAKIEAAIKSLLAQKNDGNSSDEPPSVNHDRAISATRQLRLRLPTACKKREGPDSDIHGLAQ